MGTRATYSFKDTSIRNRTTYIYIHWDGYLEGAASYFYATLVHPSKGDFATQFIRANEHAEITDSHEIHADTEYRYYVEGRGPEADIMAYIVEGTKQRLLFSGKVYEFVNFNFPYGNKFQKVELNVVTGRYAIHNVDTARIALNHPLEHLRAWKGKFEGSANWDNCIKECEILVNAFPKLMTGEIQEFLAR